jgi:hypothetical protein
MWIKKSLLILLFLFLLGCEQDKSTHSIKKQNTVEREDLNYLLKTAKDGNKTAMNILKNYYGDKSDLTKLYAWSYEEAKFGSITERINFTNTNSPLSNIVKPKNLITEWNLEEYMKFYDLNFTEIDIKFLNEKVKKGDLYAMSLLVSYYDNKYYEDSLYNQNVNRDKQIIPLLSALAKHGEVESRILLIEACSADSSLSCHNDIQEMINKWDLEYFYSNYKDTK